AHGRPDGGEVEQVRSPLVGFVLEPHADDAVRAQSSRLLAQAAESKVAGLVQRLREDGELARHITLHLRHVVRDVINAGAEHLAERLEAQGARAEELSDRQVAGPQAGAPTGGGLARQALLCTERQAAGLEGGQAAGIALALLVGGHALFLAGPAEETHHITSRSRAARALALLSA